VGSVHRRTHNVHACPHQGTGHMLPIPDLQVCTPKVQIGCDAPASVPASRAALGCACACGAHCCVGHAAAPTHGGAVHAGCGAQAGTRGDGHGA
jgi:hypothetical protein